MYLIWLKYQADSSLITLVTWVSA